MPPTWSTATNLPRCQRLLGSGLMVGVVGSGPVEAASAGETGRSFWPGRGQCLGSSNSVQGTQSAPAPVRRGSRGLQVTGVPAACGTPYGPLPGLEAAKHLENQAAHLSSGPC